MWWVTEIADKEICSLCEHIFTARFARNSIFALDSVWTSRFALGLIFFACIQVYFLFSIFKEFENLSVEKKTLSTALGFEPRSFDCRSTALTIEIHRRPTSPSPQEDN